MPDVIFTVGNVWTTVTADTTAETKLSDAFRYWVPNAERTQKYKMRQWDGYKRLYNKKLHRFPTGLLEDARDLLGNVTVKDTRIRPDHPMKPWNLRGADEREHQMEAIVAAIEEGRGIIHHATGAGKCLHPDTRVLTDDLQWVKVSSLSAGDTIVGFDEESKQHQPRRLKPSTVTGTGREHLPCYKLLLSTGETIICTNEHKWLVRDTRAQNKVRWRSADELYKLQNRPRKHPAQLARYFKPWEFDNTHNGGYIRGLLDGEGSVRKRSEYGGSFNGISFCQKNEQVLEDARTALNGYQFTERLASKGVTDFDFDTYEGIRLIGATRPRRLIEKWQNLKWPRLTRQSWVDIISIEFIGEQEVVTLATSTKTFFAEGFGSHNTEVMAAVIQMLDLPTLVLVHQKSIAEQTRKRFQERLGTKKIGLYSSGKKIEGKIVVATFQTLQAQLKKDNENDTNILWKWLQQFQVMCIDEAHHTLATTYQGLVNLIPAYYRFGFSATPDKEGDRAAYLHLVGSTGPVIDRFKAGEGVEKGLLVPAHITMLKWHEDNPKDRWEPWDFEINDYRQTYTGKKTELVEIRGKKKRVPLAPDKQQAGLYELAIVKHTVRNSFIINAAAVMVEEGLTVLILVDRIDHGEFLKRTIAKETNTNVLFLQGSDAMTERERGKDALTSGKASVLIATTIFDEGIDIPQIDGLILAGGGKAKHRIIQRLGRGMRPKKGKDGLEVVDFMDTHSRTMWRHAKERLKVYKSDPVAYIVTVEEVEL